MRLAEVMLSAACLAKRRNKGWAKRNFILRVHHEYEECLLTFALAM